MSDKFSLTNSTTISVSLVISLLMLAFFVGVLWTRVNYTANEVDRLTSSTDEVIESNNQTQRDLVIFNGRVDNLNTRLDDFSRRLDGWSQQSSVTVRPTQPASQVVVVPAKSDDEPEQQGSSQSPPDNKPPEEEPEESPEEPRPTPLDRVLQPAIDLLTTIGG